MKTKPKTRINNTATRISLTVTAFAAELVATFFAVKYLGIKILIINYSIALIVFLCISNAECDAVYKIITMFFLIFVPIISTISVIALAISYVRTKFDDNILTQTNFYSAEYFDCGDKFFYDLTEKLTNARSRIYIEYYIIKNGKIWESIKNILTKKAESGVDVCLYFDAIGCYEMPRKFKKWLKSHNIKCFCFNRLTLLPNLYLNCRTHRKIAVIDASVYLGGINISDEYLSASERFGIWKDCAARFDGEISNEFAKLFSLRKIGDFVFDCDMPKSQAKIYFEYPLKSSVFENCLIEMIYKSDSTKISSPYLAPDYSFKQALKHALLSGKSVQFFLPGVPDKKIVYRISMIFAEELFNLGAEIYIFEPGFLHAKLALTDNAVIIGSSNADYRSFYLQFESGVITKCPSLLKAVENDFISIQSASRRLTFPPRKGFNKLTCFFKRTAARIIAPFI